MSCISLENPFFYSLPTSPTCSKAIPNISLVSQTEPTTPFTFDEDPTSSELDYFEFDISSGHFDLNIFETEISKTQSLSHDRQQVQVIERGDSMPRSTTMAFADELFCDGKVTPLLTPPLKLPPRLQHGHHLKLPSQSPKLKTSLQIFKNNNDLPDPFLVALQNVTSEGGRDTPIRRESKFGSLRRAWSFSSFWASGPKRSTSFTNMGDSEFDQSVGPTTSTSLFELLDLDHNNRKDRSLSPNGPILIDQKNNVGSSSKGLTWPDGPSEPTFLTDSVPIGETTMEGTESRVCLSESKRYKIKKFLLGDASVRRFDENKQKDSAAALWKPWLRKIGLKPVKLRSGRDNKAKSIYKLVRMTAVHYRPRLSLCLGGTERM